MHKLLQYMHNKEKEDRVFKEKQNNSLRLTVHCYHPVIEELMDIRMNLYYDTTLEDAINMAHKRFKLDGLVDVDDCRLVIFNKKQSCIDYSFETNELKICDIVDKYKIYCIDWLLETKQPGKLNLYLTKS